MVYTTWFVTIGIKCVIPFNIFIKLLTGSEILYVYVCVLLLGKNCQSRKKITEITTRTNGAPNPIE